MGTEDFLNDGEVKSGIEANIFKKHYHHTNFFHRKTHYYIPKIKM